MVLKRVELEEKSQFDFTNSEDVLGAFDERITRLMKTVKNMQIDHGDWHHLLLRQKKHITQMQSRIHILEENTLDLEEMAEGESINTQDFIKYMQKIKADLSNKMLT